MFVYRWLSGNNYNADTYLLITVADTYLLITVDFSPALCADSYRVNRLCYVCNNVTDATSSRSSDRMYHVRNN